VVSAQFIRERRIADSPLLYGDITNIIKYLGITNEFYFNKGIEFGGEYIEEETLYFHYKRDINKFKKWLEKNIDSFLVAKALVNNK
jgi:hypothetical protein